jgi:hypothetical protein
LLVLHAVWSNSLPGRLHLWAESSELADASYGRSRGRASQAKVVKARPHPFCLSGATLLEAASSGAGSLLAEGGAFDLLALCLPSTSKEPLPSPQLILEEPRKEKASNLLPWEVATLAFEAGLALDLLRVLPAQPPRGLIYGHSLNYWVEAAWFGLELVTRQRFVATVKAPVVKSAKASAKKGDQLASSYRATWQIELDRPDQERLYTLAKAMPPLCRARVVDPGDENTEIQPLELLTDFLNQGVDSLVRQSLAATPLLPRKMRKGAAQPLPEQWLHALASPDDPTLTAPAQELKKFAAEVQGWLKQLRAVDSKAPFRTCFRLEPPGSESDNIEIGYQEDNTDGDWLEESKNSLSADKNWRLGFYLQANDDLSLLVEAEQVWKERSSTLTMLKRNFENPQERLLADLGKASRFYPTLEESLKTARPTGLVLDTAQTYHFLRFVAPLLEQSGFGVLLPSWWSKPQARLGVKMRVRPKQEAKVTSGLLGLDGLVQYDWQVALGDQMLSAKEFEKLAKLKVPLVKVRGQWVELKPEEMEAALKFFQKKHMQGEMTLGEALQMGLGGEGEAAGAGGLPVLEMETEGWVNELLDKLAHSEKISPIEPPSEFQG